MCGIAGVISLSSPPDPRQAERMAEVLAHRGPDDQGVWCDARAALAHRRLAVIDPTPAGRQPFATPDGRFVLVYNGELYNEREVRAELEAEGIRFHTECDTETVLLALARWGLQARAKLRGMYALALWDTQDHRLLLGRDELGVKPLYFAPISDREFAFASEPPALFQHPSVAPRPDPIAIAAYLSTIQIAVGRRTLFEGVGTLEPGEWLSIETTTGTLSVEVHPPEWNSYSTPEGTTGDVIRASAHLQLRADVPTCCLLSGGLDSSVLSSLALEVLPRLDTYCAGARSGDSIGPTSEDFRHAREVSDHVGSRHTEAPVSRELFLERWPQLIQRAGLPLCTPNEVAINEVARTLRADGKVVTLSGEGADELFAGYTLPLMLAHDHVASNDDRSSDALHFLTTIRWAHPAQLGALLADTNIGEEVGPWIAGLHADAVEQADRDFPTLSDADRRLCSIVGMQRRVNLPNLLRRLDQATMLESVEGRTPYADRVVARHAETLPLNTRFRPDPTTPGTKLALRNAFANCLPASVVSRPKASFPLPFESWLDGATHALDGSFARAWFTPDAREQLRTDPKGLFTVAWPVLNIAMWGERWWG